MCSPLIAVIILTFNRPDRCRDSVTKNRVALSAFPSEWFIINNGGEAVDFPEEIHGIDLNKNQGTGARNIALRQATAPFVLMIDDDAYLSEPTVQSALQTLQASPEAGCCIIPVKDEGCLLPTIFHGCAVLFRTEALQQVGGYPEDYLYYGEEYEVTFRLAAAGYSIIPAPPETPPAIHVRDAGGRNKDHIIYRNIRNNTLCWARHFPLSALPGAVFDTLHRYRHVAEKEAARAGYRRGLCALPAAVLRGLCSRKPISGAAFHTLTLQRALQALKIPKAAPTVLCGLGKFPSLWTAVLRPYALLEQNPGFHGKTFRGCPIRTYESFVPRPNTLYVVGLSSAPANAYWTHTLEAAGCSLIRSSESLKLFSVPHSG